MRVYCLCILREVGGETGVTNLRPDESLKAGLEVVDAAVVELGHLVQQLLVLGLEVVPDRSELLSGLRCGEETKERVTIGQSHH